MPCPFFFPLRKLALDGWDPAPRLPLGAFWDGECRVGSQPAAPDDHELCNSGYARERCSHFPSHATNDARGDAVRFSFSEGKLIYVIEKDHAPLEYGVMDVALEPREILAAQARAFLESSE